MNDGLNIDSNGTKRWYLNGKQHRTDGPAVEFENGDKYWYLNDKRHRTDGPAVEHSNGNKQWWINGVFLSEEEYLHRTRNFKLELLGL